MCTSIIGMNKLFLILLTTIPFLAFGQERDSIPQQKLAEIEISANSRPSTTQSTTPLQVITSQEIQQKGIQSLSDAIRRFNGVVLKDYGGLGGLKTVSLRGMGAEHTSVSYDGIALNNVQSGQIDISRFSLENIEMLSLSIGQSDDIFQSARAFASAGTLNLQTITPKFDKNNYKGFAKIKGGSFGLFNPSVYYAQKLNNTFAVSANGSWQRADGNYKYQVENGDYMLDKKRKNVDVSMYNAELNLYSNFKKAGTLNIKAYYYDSEMGLPNTDLYNEYATERLYDKNIFGQALYNVDIYTNFKFKSQFKFDRTKTRYTDRKERYSDGLRVMNFEQKEIYWSNSFLYIPHKYISISLSEDLFRNSLDKYDNDESLMGQREKNPIRYNSLTALTTQFKNSRLTANATLLATYIHEEKKESKTDNYYKKLNPSASLSYAPFLDKALRVRASYNNTFRVPSFTELYYTEIDASIKPEKAQQINIGTTWITSLTHFKYNNRIEIYADGYFNKVKDKIVIRPVTSFLSRAQNLGDVDIKGLDIRLLLQTSFSPKYELTVSGTYSYIQALDMTDKESENYKKQILYTPENSGSGNILFSNPWVDISYTIIGAGKRYYWFQSIDKYRIDGYTDHSIALSKKLNLNDYQLFIQAGVENMLNKNYEIIKTFPMPGRSFNISAKVEF